MFSIGETSRPLGIDSPLNLKTITSKEEEEDEESEPKKLYTIFSEDDDHSEQESLKNNPKYNHKTSNDPNLDQLSNQLKVSDSDLGSDIISSLGQKQSSTSDESTAEDLANRRFFDSVFENLWNMDSTSKLLFSRCKNEASLMVDEPTSFQAKMYKVKASEYLIPKFFFLRKNYLFYTNVKKFKKMKKFFFGKISDFLSFFWWIWAQKSLNSLRSVSVVFFYHFIGSKQHQA